MVATSSATSSAEHTAASSQETKSTADVDPITYGEKAPRTMLTGLVIIAIAAGLFLWFGGLRWVRQRFSMSRFGYKKVDEDDVEK